MRRAPNQSSSPDGRTRYLNIVYFIESARSHTVRINLSHARWALGGLILVGAWALGSLVWIIHLQYQSAKTRARLETALTTIFDYQIKADGVFDQAYPPGATNGYYSELAQLPSNNPLVDLPETQVSQPTNTPKSLEKEIVGAPVSGKSNGVTTPKAVTAEGLTKANSTTNPVTVGIEITGARLAKLDRQISLEFHIRNKKPERAEGFIWAVAIITEPNGHMTPIAAPEHTKIDPKSGAALSPKSAYRFSILRFKDKEFDFQVPATSSWKLTKLTIYFSDLNGQHEQRVEVPVEHVAVTSVIDTPSTEIKL